MAIDVVKRFDKAPEPCARIFEEDTSGEFLATGYGGFDFETTAANELVPVDTKKTTLYRSPRIDFGAAIKTAKASLGATGTDLKCFVRSGSKTEVDKNEVRHTLQADFEAGLKKEGISIDPDEGKLMAAGGEYKILSLWHFNEGDGTTVNDSIGTHHGTFSGTTYWEKTYQKLGTACGKFDGDDYVSVTNHQDFRFGDGSNDYPRSISLWIKVDAYGTQSQGLVSKWSNQTGQQEWVFYLRGGDTLEFYIRDDLRKAGLRKTSTQVLTSTDWQFLAMTYDGSGSTTGINIWLDGEKLPCVEETAGTYEASSQLDVNLFIGQYEDPNVGKFKGLIDEVVFYHRELSETEIKRIFEDGKAGKELGIASSSDFESSIIDLGSAYQGDLIAIQSDIPAGCSLQLQARSGSEAQAAYAGIPGVTPKYTTPGHLGTSGTLFYNKTYGTLQWRDDGQPTPKYGEAKSVIDGVMQIPDGANDANFIEVEVATGYLPTYDAEEEYLTSVWQSFSPDPTLNLENTGNNRINFINTTNTNANFELAAQSNRFWQYKIKGTTNEKTSWAVRDVIFLPKPTDWDDLRLLEPLTESTVVQKCKRNRYWQWILVGASDGTRTWVVTSFKIEANFFAIDLLPTTPFGGYPLFNIGCTNLKKLELTTAEAEKIYAVGYSSEEKNLAEFQTIDWIDAEKTLDLTGLEGSTVSAEAADMFQARLIRANVLTHPTSPVIKAFAKNDLAIYAGKRFELRDAAGNPIPTTGTGEEERYVDGSAANPLITDIRGDTDIYGNTIPTGPVERRVHAVGGLALSSVKMLIRSETAGVASYVKFSTSDDYATAKTIDFDAKDAPLELGNIQPGYFATFYFWVDADAAAKVGTFEFEYQFYWITEE